MGWCKGAQPSHWFEYSQLMGEATQWIFGVSIVSGLVSARVDVSMMNAGLRGSSAMWERVVAVAGLLNGIAALSLFIWAFIELPWYVPVAFFVGQAVLLPAIVRSVDLLVLSLMRPVLASLCVAGAGWCWVDWLGSA